jgi:uncharacterized oxidoreductase
MQVSANRILITGGGSGIGLELARLLSHDNQVVIAGRSEARLEDARVRTPALSTRRLDVTSEDDARDAIAWVDSELGGLDLLVNSAGLLRGYPLSAGDAGAKSSEDLAVNLHGAIRMTRLALPLLGTRREGAVVFISSAVALAAVPGFAVYAATKAAVHSLARSLRAELRQDGIRVFEVIPPAVDTGPMGDLEVPKLSPATVAAAIVSGLRRDREEIRIGRIRQLAPLARLSPSLADRLVTRALTPPAGTPRGRHVR